MFDRSVAVRTIVQLIPDSLPGKTRIARFLVRSLIDCESACQIPDRFGNVLTIPNLKEPIALSLFAFGVYEPETIHAILLRLSHSGVYVDVGANVGAIALAIAARRPGAQIVCVEADPEIAEVLRQNVHNNVRSNVKAIECLAGPTADPSVAFYRAPKHKFGMGSIGPQFNAAPASVRQQTLDCLLDSMGITDVDIVKLDVEGSELGVLRGFTSRLNGPRPPAIVFEFADWAEARIAGQSPGDCQAYLLSLGYRLLRIASNGLLERPLHRPLTSGTAMILALPGTNIHPKQ
jgi:FkbM family methyltransferase